MNTARIEFPREQAHELYLKYKAHRDQATPEDRKIEEIYRRISRGEKVIRALESVRQAGLDAQGRPVLALIPAHAKECYFAPNRDHVIFQMDRWGSDSWTRRRVRVPWPDFPGATTRGAKAVVPLVPVHLRPKADLVNYHILWEADWVNAPVDPMLLKRFGNDLWLVLAAWDLTIVERAVLGGA